MALQKGVILFQILLLHLLDPREIKATIKSFLEHSGN
jgi:hypothetical protein